MIEAQKAGGSTSSAMEERDAWFVGRKGSQHPLSWTLRWESKRLPLDEDFFVGRCYRREFVVFPVLMRYLSFVVSNVRSTLRSQPSYTG